MADKELKIRAVIDQSGFDQQINQLQQKMRQMDTARGMGERGQGTAFGAAAQSYYEREKQSTLEPMKREFNLQEQYRRNQERSLKQTDSQLKDINKSEIERNKLLKDREEIENRINETLRKQIDLADKARKIDPTLAGFKGAQQPPKPPTTEGVLGGAGGGGGGGDGAGGGGGAAASFTKILRAIGAGAILSGALNAVATVTKDYATRERQMLVMEKGQFDYASRGMREISQGRGSDAAYWAKERAEAASIGVREIESQKRSDLIGAAGTAVTGGIAGALIGIPGGPGGMVVGAVVGATGAVMRNERYRALFTDPEKYKTMLQEQGIQSAMQSEATLMARDPRRQIARNFFTENTERLSGLERMTGTMTDQEMYGPNGLLNKQMAVGKRFLGGGFQLSDIESQMQGIRGGGGTTEAIRELAGQSAAYSRQLNIGNSAQTMGGMSGAGLSSGQVDQAYMRLLSEAVRLGVDASKMPQEMEKFTAIAAQMATAGGGFSSIAAQTMGLGMIGDFSKTGIEGAKTFAEEHEQRASAAGGAEGQVGAAFLISHQVDEAFGAEAGKKIRKDFGIRNLLNQVTAEQAEKDPIMLKGLSKRLGITEEQLLSGLRKKDTYKETLTSEEQTAAEEYGKSIENIDPKNTKSFLLSEEGNEAAKKNLDLLIQRVGVKGPGIITKGAAARQAELAGVSRMSVGQGMDERNDLISENEVALAMAAPSKRGTDAQKASAAVGDKLNIDVLSENIKNFAKSAKDTNETTILFNRMFDTFRQGFEDNGKKVNTTLGTLQTQLQALAEKLHSQDPLSAGPSGENK